VRYYIFWRIFNVIYAQVKNVETERGRTELECEKWEMENGIPNLNEWNYNKQQPRKIGVVGNYKRVRR